MLPAQHSALTPSSTAALRAELARLRARYDCAAVSPAIYAVIRALETAIAWAEHREVRR
jgi:hypothetical protein